LPFDGWRLPFGPVANGVGVSCAKGSIPFVSVSRRFRPGPGSAAVFSAEARRGVTACTIVRRVCDWLIAGSTDPAGRLNRAIAPDANAVNRPIDPSTSNVATPPKALAAGTNHALTLPAA
jgi:hypothetical protein